MAWLRGGEGERNPLSSLLGGVLNGESLSSADALPVSGAREAFPGFPDVPAMVLPETEAGLLGILGLPARLIGGGPPALEASEGDLAPNSLSDVVDVDFNGSGEEAVFGFACKKGAWRASMAGVVALLCPRKCRKEPVCGEPERGDGDGCGCCGTLRGVGAFGSGSWKLLDDLGELTVTRGGDLEGDLGGELRGDSWYMEIGRALLASTDMPRVSGVRGGAYSPLGDVLRRPTFGRGRSSDMRPSARVRDSSPTSNMFDRLARGFLGVGGSGVADDCRLSMFSKWLRSDETGFYNGVSARTPRRMRASSTYDGGAIGLRFAGRFLHGCLARTAAQIGRRRTSADSCPQLGLL